MPAALNRGRWNRGHRQRLLCALTRARRMSRFSILLLALALPLAACGSDEPDASGSIADAAESVEALPASGGPGERPTVSGATVVDVSRRRPS